MENVIANKLDSLSKVYPGFPCGAWDADDIAQEMLIAHWRGLKRCRRWIVLDYLRQFNPNRSAKVPGDGFPYVLPPAQFREPDPAMLAEIKDFVQWLLSVLPERLRAVLTGLYLDGKRTAELAVEFGVSAARISQLKKQALEVAKRNILEVT